MTWFKVDDGLHSHPKWIAASLSARALWVTAGSWSASHLTDGHIPRHVLASLGGRPKHAAELVDVGLWTVDGDGWRFHDWDTFQPSAESVQAERVNARERQRRAREKARASRRDGSARAGCSETANVSEEKTRNGNDGVSAHAERPTDPVTRQNGEASRRDSRVNDAVSHGPPDPTRPDQYIKGGGSLQTAADGPPPRRCPQHTDNDNPPPCGACADARRAHITWLREHTTTPPSKPSPLDGQQSAARARAERHLRMVTGEACQDCADTGIRLDEDGKAIPCNHHQAATP